MVVSEDKKQAVVGYYKILNQVNNRFKRIYLKGLDEKISYQINGGEETYWGAELMQAGLIVSDSSCWQLTPKAKEIALDFSSRIYKLQAVE